jgi:hypothetical protein
MTGPLDEAIWRLTGRDPETLRATMRLPQSELRARRRRRPRRRVVLRMKPALLEAPPPRRTIVVVHLPERPMLTEGDRAE